MPLDAHARAVTALAVAATGTATTHLGKGWRDGPRPGDPDGWDLKIGDHYTPRLRTALARTFTRQDLRHAIDTARILAPYTGKAPGTPWDAAHRHVVAATAVGSLAAATITTAAAVKALQQLYAAAWMTGARTAAATTGGTIPGAIAAVIAHTNWDTWTPGNTAAALKAADGGLAELLAGADATIRGITRTTMTRIGDAIAAGLAAGDNLDSIAAELDGILGDPTRAMTIAHTETARATTAASLDLYQANGITQWEWLTTSGACPYCLDRESSNPHDYGEPAPPGHPLCRCAVAPATDWTTPTGGGSPGTSTTGLPGDAEAVDFTE